MVELVKYLYQWINHYIYDANTLWIFLGEKLSFLPGWVISILAGGYSFVLIAAFLVIMVMFQTWLERKESGHIQSRHGPMRVGLWHGWAQPIADTIKLLIKEDITPKAVDLWVFRLAPIVVFIPSFMAYACIPFGNGLIASNLDIGIIYIVAITSLVVTAIIMASWSSGNKYAMMAGFRSAAQIVSYEIPMIISILSVIIIVGSLKMNDFVSAQERVWLFWIQPLAFLIYFISAVAETNRAPFDLPEAESELVAGYFIEYTGIKFALFFLAEYTNMVTVSAVSTTLFFGGWRDPLCFFGLQLLPPFVWFLIKVLLHIFVIMWFRWTFPRLRIDQLMNFCWKVLLPLSLINLAVTGFIAVLGGYDLFFKYIDGVKIINTIVK